MEDFRITGVEVKQIGVFEDLKLEFPESHEKSQAEIHIFTGENGSGKTTLLEVLKGLFMVEGLQKKFLYLEKSIFNVQTNIGPIRYSISETGHPSYYAVGNKYNKLRDSFFSPSKSVFHEVAFFAYSGFRKVDSGIEIQAIEEDRKSPFSYSLSFDKSIDSNSIIQGLAYIINSDYRAIAKGIPLEERQSFALRKLEEALSELFDKRISFDLEENPLRLMVDYGSVKLEFDNLADGVKSMISWMCDLIVRMQRVKWKDNIPLFDRRIILFLDEIEVHLHPAWQRKILPLVQKLFRNAQIFISTHSPFVVGSVDGAFVYKFEFDGKKTTIGPPVVSEDALSYETILRDVFGIESLFGPAIENQLKEFKNLRTKIFTEKKADDFKEAERLAQKLATENDSPELEQILSLEMRQLSKLFPQ